MTTAIGTLRNTSKDTLRDVLARFEKEGAALGQTVFGLNRGVDAAMEGLRDAIVQVAH